MREGGAAAPALKWGAVQQDGESGPSIIRLLRSRVATPTVGLYFRAYSQLAPSLPPSVLRRSSSLHLQLYSTPPSHPSLEHSMRSLSVTRGAESVASTCIERPWSGQGSGLGCPSFPSTSGIASASASSWALHRIIPQFPLCRSALLLCCSQSSGFDQACGTQRSLSLA